MTSLDLVSMDPFSRLKIKDRRIKSTSALLRRLSNLKAREAFARETDIDQRTLLQLANHCDLMRIKGLSTKYIALLRAAGCHTVRDLRMRNARKLRVMILNANRDQRVVELPPSEKFVARWIEQAKRLDLVITY